MKQARLCDANKKPYPDSIVALVAFVSRSKLVLDFALTLHFVHLVVVTLYTGFLPRNAMWWATMVSSSVVTVVGGTYGCRWRELRPINFGGGGGGGGRAAVDGDGAPSADPSALEAGTAGGGAGGGVGGEGDGGGNGDGDDVGFSRGRGRGRGRDGGGEYEMVSLKGDRND